MKRNLDFEDLNELLNIALATINIKTLTLPTGRKIRPTCHILIYGMIGSGKSSITKEMADYLNQTIYMGITHAHLSGSIDKNTGLLAHPVIWDCRRSFLIIDEYYLNTKDASGKNTINYLLKLMEDPTISKKVGYRCNDFLEKDSKEHDLFCKAKDSKITCKSKFGVIINTMMDIEHSKMQEIKALMSRCLCIPFFPSYEYLDKQLDGEMDFKFKNIKVKENIKIKKKDYMFIRNYLKSKNINITSYMRLTGDLCRILAVQKTTDKCLKSFELITQMHKRQKLEA